MARVRILRAFIKKAATEVRTDEKVKRGFIYGMAFLGWIYLLVSIIIG